MNCSAPQNVLKPWRAHWKNGKPVQPIIVWKFSSSLRWSWVLICNRPCWYRETKKTKNVQSNIYPILFSHLPFDDQDRVRTIDLPLGQRLLMGLNLSSQVPLFSWQLLQSVPTLSNTLIRHQVTAGQLSGGHNHSNYAYISNGLKHIECTKQFTFNVYRWFLFHHFVYQVFCKLICVFIFLRIC